MTKVAEKSMKKRGACVAGTKVHKFWFELPLPLYEAFIQECVDLGVPRKTGLVMAIEQFIKNSDAFKDFLKKRGSK